MSDDDKVDAPIFRVRAGRNGSREYLVPDWKPGDPPFYVIPREPVRERLETIRKNGRPRALSTNQALQIIAFAHTLKEEHRREDGRVNVHNLANTIVKRVFGKSSDIKRNENVRQLIRTLDLGE